MQRNFAEYPFHALGRIRYRGIAAGKNSWPLHLCLPVCEYGTRRRARKRTATERRRKEDDARSDEGSGVARGTGRTSARGVRGGMRAGSRPGPSPARGEEEGRRPEEEGGGRPGGLGEKGGRCAEGRKRPPEEGKRAAEEDRCPTAAEPEGEEVDVRLVRECVLYAYFNAETEKATLAEHHLPELPRTPFWRSYSTKAIAPVRYLRTVAPIYSVTGAMRTSGAFSAAHPALYLRQLDLGGVRLAQINGLLLAVLAVVKVPVRPTLTPLLQLQHSTAVGSPLDDGARGASSR